MIISFGDKETEKVFNQEFSTVLPRDIQRRAARKLILLNDATNLSDLKSPPANRLEKFTGKRKGQYSIRINQQWRICFNWQKMTASNVEIVDYH